LDAAAGHSSVRFDVYLATDLRQGEHRREASEADMVQRFVTEADLSRMIRSGQFRDAQSLAAWALYREHGA
jgi:8-oxo-dGDP phosphatase